MNKKLMLSLSVIFVASIIMLFLALVSGNVVFLIGGISYKSLELLVVLFWGFIAFSVFSTTEEIVTHIYKK